MLNLDVPRRNIRRAILRAFLILALLPALSRTVSAYTNPYFDILGIGDPAVLQYNGGYYLYVTTGAGTGGPDLGFKVWYSTDLLDWQPKGWALLKDNTTWGQSTFWMGDIKFRDGWFYLLYSCSQAPNGPKRVCVARSQTPTGLFTEYRTPLLSRTNENVDPFVFTDDNGKSYLYWSDFEATYHALWVQEISADFGTMIGSPTRVLGPNFSPWEIASNGLPIAEAPVVLKKSGVYYLMYSGNLFSTSDYAIGYATSTRPTGPFTRSKSNPILAKNFNISPKVSGPGSHSVVKSPDGREMFCIYAAHHFPDSPSGDRMIYIDRMGFEGWTLKIYGPTTSPQADPSGVVPSAAATQVEVPE